MKSPARIFTPFIVTVLFALTACGGGGSEEPAPAPPPPPPPPPAGTLIGAAGGMVTGPSGTSVVIPAGALSTEARVLIEQSSTGSPALPTGDTSIAPIYAITPHGTTFTQPVTVTLPFDPAQVPIGRKPQLYKTNAQNQWERVPNAVFGTNTVTAQVTGFSYWAQILPMLVNGRPVYQWEVTKLFGNDLRESNPPGNGRSIDENLIIFHDIGPAHRDAPVFDANGVLMSAPNGQATDFVGGTDNGADWFLGTEAPLGNHNLDEAIGSRVFFRQRQSWIKRDVDATMSFFIINAFLEVSDRNEPLGRQCPPQRRFGLYCDMISAQIFFSAEAFTLPLAPFADFDYFYRLAGGVEITGHANSWTSEAFTSASSQDKLWGIEDFDFDIQTLDGSEGALVTMDLAHPIFHEYVIDLSEIAVGQAFTVDFGGITTTYNRAATAYDGIGTEFPTSARAYLRDPLRQHGVKMNAVGVEPIDTPDPELKPVAGVRDPAACPAPNPNAGSIQFAAANFVQSESNTSQNIVVTRTGGTEGAVTATFSTRDGSGVDGEDYSRMMTTVFFGDGDDAPRTVTVNAIGDSVHSEPDFTVNLEVSHPGFCATIGNPHTAVLTIQDDDAPPPPPSFTVSGTVTGLVGTSLELDDLTFRPITTGNGAFTMLSPVQSGRPYAVRVSEQPTNPVQACTVVNGSGTMGNANVTNVQVNCAAPVAAGALDASFGGTGKVAATFGGEESAMVLQPDGKIVIAGGVGDFTVARYNVDGTLDAGFGTGGVANTDIAGGSDRAHAVALQSDGKIVVAGYARVGSSDDFAVVRYLANGTPDPSFGTAGETTVDFFGVRNRAYAVAIAADGRVIVAGETNMPAGGGDFALVRLSAGGVVDAGFGGTTDGKVTTDIAAGVDNARNLVIGSNGTLLVTGTITMNGDPSLEHFGAARYTGEGVLDASFDTDGRLAIANRSVGDALALQPDGKLLVAGNTLLNGRRVFALMRLNSNGSVDGGFGTQGLATTAFSSADDFGRGIALQPDGKILVSGQSSNQSNPNFAVARYLTSGAPDLSFDGDGLLQLDFFGAGDSAENVAVLADGRIVLSGFAVNGGQVRFALARIQP